MSEYHKIQTVFKRDPETKYKTLLDGEYALPEFEYLADNRWLFTEKVDGTNIRAIWDGESLSFAGRTDRAQIPPFLLEALEGELTEGLWADFDGPAVLYGEGYGPKIQKGGGNYRDTPGFVLFDVNVGGWWLERQSVEDIARKFEIDVVPVIGGGNLAAMVDLARGGFKSQWGDFMAEGIVARPSTELRTRSGHRVITKIKCKDFPA